MKEGMSESGDRGTDKEVTNNDGSTQITHTGAGNKDAQEAEQM